MLKKIINISYLILFFIFFISISYYYFSSKNIRNTSKSRSEYSFNLSFNNLDIPLLKNDTTNIIEYSDDLEKYKKEWLENSLKAILLTKRKS